MKHLISKLNLRNTLTISDKKIRYSISVNNFQYQNIGYALNLRNTCQTLNESLKPTKLNFLQGICKGFIAKASQYCKELARTLRNPCLNLKRNLKTLKKDFATDLRWNTISLSQNTCNFARDNRCNSLANCKDFVTEIRLIYKHT